MESLEWVPGFLPLYLPSLKKLKLREYMCM